jgi:cell cycle related kinase
VLKLGDFGLARVHNSNLQRPYSHQVATRWYRSPELLYGARKYDVGVDLWATGTIFAELVNHYPLFPAQNDIEQLYCVQSILGTPTAESWPQMADLPDYNKIQFPVMPAVPLEQVFPDADSDAVFLLKRFLVYQSDLRIQAKDALLDPYFYTAPLPAHHSELLTIPVRSSLSSSSFAAGDGGGGGVETTPVKKFNVDAPLTFDFLIKSN